MGLKNYLIKFFFLGGNILKLRGDVFYFCMDIGQIIKLMQSSGCALSFYFRPGSHLKPLKTENTPKTAHIFSNIG